MVDSFYPRQSVQREELVERLELKFGRWDDQTHLRYLGRPETQSKQVVNHDVRYLKTNTLVPKQHTMKRILPAKKGVIEKLGRAKMIKLKNGEVWYNLFYPRQATLKGEVLSPAASPTRESNKEECSSGLTAGLTLDEPAFFEGYCENESKKNSLSYSGW